MMSAVKRHSFAEEVSLLTVHWHRTNNEHHFELHRKYRYLLSTDIASIMREYADWFEYPKGNHVLKGHSHWVMDAVVSSDGRDLFTAGRDRHIFHWDLTVMEKSEQWEAHSDCIRSIDYCSGRLISGSEDCSVCISDAYAHRVDLVMSGHSKNVTQVQFDPNDESRCLSASDDCTIRVWSAITGVCQMILDEHYDWVRSARFISDRIVSVSFDRTLRVWNIETGKCERNEFRDEFDIFDCITWNEQCSFIVRCVYDERTCLFSWPELKKMGYLSDHALSAAFHPRKPLVFALTGQSSPSVWLFDACDLSAPIRTLSGHQSDTKQCCFTPDGSRLITVSYDTTVRVWDLTEEEEKVEE